MGQISKLPNGDVSAVFDKASLATDELSVLHIAISSFSHLVKRNTRLSFGDFATVIRSQYDQNNIKTKLCLDIIAKAAIRNRYICTFKVANDANSGLVETTKVVTAETWDSVLGTLSAFYGTDIVDLQLEQTMSVSYKKGTVSIDANTIENKL